MDYFGRENLKELLEERTPPAISIYLPTHRTSSDWEGDRLRYRAALDRARELLETEYEPDTYKPLLQSLEPLLNDKEFWLYQSDGLAMFRAPEFTRVYRLPTGLPELVVVGPSFHTRPLIQFLQAPDRFWILGLSQNDVRLWEGTTGGIRPVDLGRVPKSLRDAVTKYVNYERESFHSSLGAGRSPAFHGHGPGMDAKDWELEAFCRQVDKGMRELLDPGAGPVILAGVEKDLSIYRSVSQLKNLADEAIKGNVSHWSHDMLHQAGWPIVERIVDRKVDDALRLWESAYALDKTEADIATSGRLAVAGRVRLLMTDRERRIWGHMDRKTGAVTVVQENGDDPGNNAVDLLDELAETVILRGGEALTIPGTRMPTRTGVASVLR